MSMNLRTKFRFTLPKGTGFQAVEGNKVNGVMELVKAKHIVEIQRDSSVQKNTSAFYMVLLTKTIKELGREGMITRKTIEKLHPVDFSFLIDFLHEINNQVVSSIPITCNSCHHKYKGAFHQLGEA